MSYYDNSPQSQWAGQPQQPQPQQQQQNNWEHQGVTSPARAGANGPQPQDEYAFSYQFDEVDRAYENLSKSGKGYGMGGNRRKFSPMHGPGSARRTPDFEGGRMPHGPSPRSQSVHNFDDARGSGGQNLHNFYAQQRNQPSRGTNEAEQVMQAKRRMAAQRERELRNLHTEQQYQRNALTDVPPQGANAGNSPANNNSSKQMSEEETRELIARQRSALYGEGPFAEQGSYVDENGSVRPGPHGPSGPPSLRGQSPMTFDSIGRKPSGPETNTHGSAGDPALMSSDLSPRPASTSSPQTTGPPNKVFDNAVGAQSRTSTSSPTGGSPPRDMAPGSKPGVSSATVAPIGTRPSGTPSSTGPGGNRSTPPQGATGGWGRGTGVWGQSSGLGTQASVWG